MKSPKRWTWIHLIQKTDGDLQSYLTQRFGFGPMGNAGNQTVDVDLFLDAAGAPNVIPEFFHMCKRFARLVVIAGYKQAIEFNPLPMLNQECSIIGTGPYDSDTVKEVIGYLEAKNTVSKISLPIALNWMRSTKHSRLPEQTHRPLRC